MIDKIDKDKQMKIVSNCLILALASTSLSLQAANIDQLISHDSLGKDVLQLNQTYKLGLNKASAAYLDGKKSGHYFTGSFGKCELQVMADNANKVSSISVSTNDCDFTTNSNVLFDSRKTSLSKLLKQVKLSEVSFEQGCYNCPSRIQLLDNLVINRPKDKFYTEFEISGYNNQLKEYMVKKLAKVHQKTSNKWEALSWLDNLKSEDLFSFKRLTDRKDFKEKAIATYNLEEVPYRYTIKSK